MRLYNVYKVLDNNELLLAHSVYAHNSREAASQVVALYSWNNWITAENCVCKRA